MLNRIGWPRLIDDAPAFWSQISIARNARKMRFPLLLNSPDDEYLSTLQGYTALRQAGSPVDMFVFPDEHHIKWQPAHRLAVYERSLDWFNFWIKRELPPSGRRLAEAQYWQTLRDPQQRSNESAMYPATPVIEGKGG